MPQNITDIIFKDIEKKLHDDGYHYGTEHPFWILFNYKSKILHALSIRDKVAYHKKLFPDNELLKELWSND